LKCSFIVWTVISYGNERENSLGGESGEERGDEKGISSTAAATLLEGEGADCSDILGKQ
jgi:hypothetical protein